MRGRYGFWTKILTAVKNVPAEGTTFGIKKIGNKKSGYKIVSYLGLAFRDGSSFDEEVGHVLQPPQVGHLTRHDLLHAPVDAHGNNLPTIENGLDEQVWQLETNKLAYLHGVN
jgi:hypothetical protein